jgi:hypothetical protein
MIEKALVIDTLKALQRKIRHQIIQDFSSMNVAALAAEVEIKDSNNNKLGNLVKHEEAVIAFYKEQFPNILDGKNSSAEQLEAIYADQLKRAIDYVVLTPIRKAMRNKIRTAEGRDLLEDVSLIMKDLGPALVNACYHNNTVDRQSGQANPSDINSALIEANELNAAKTRLHKRIKEKMDADAKQFTVAELDKMFFNEKFSECGLYTNPQVPASYKLNIYSQTVASCNAEVKAYRRSSLFITGAVIGLIFSLATTSTVISEYTATSLGPKALVATGATFVIAAGVMHYLTNRLVQPKTEGGKVACTVFAASVASFPTAFVMSQIIGKSYAHGAAAMGIAAMASIGVIVVPAIIFCIVGNCTYIKAELNETSAPAAAR